MVGYELVSAICPLTNVWEMALVRPFALFLSISGDIFDMEQKHAGGGPMFSSNRNLENLEKRVGLGAPSSPSFFAPFLSPRSLSMCGMFLLRLRLKPAIRGRSWDVQVARIVVPVVPYNERLSQQEQWSVVLPVFRAATFGKIERKKLGAVLLIFYGTHASGESPARSIGQYANERLWAQ